MSASSGQSPSHLCWPDSRRRRPGQGRGLGAEAPARTAKPPGKRISSTLSCAVGAPGVTSPGLGWGKRGGGFSSLPLGGPGDLHPGQEKVKGRGFPLPFLEKFLKETYTAPGRLPPGDGEVSYLREIICSGGALPTGRKSYPWDSSPSSFSKSAHGFFGWA